MKKRDIKNRLKRGALRDDGYRLWNYHIEGFPIFLSPEAYKNAEEGIKRWNLKNREKINEISRRYYAKKKAERLAKKAACLESAEI